MKGHMNRCSRILKVCALASGVFAATLVAYGQWICNYFIDKGASCVTVSPLHPPNCSPELCIGDWWHCQQTRNDKCTTAYGDGMWEDCFCVFTWRTCQRRRWVTSESCSSLTPQCGPTYLVLDTQQFQCVFCDGGRYCS